MPTRTTTRKKRTTKKVPSLSSYRAKKTTKSKSTNTKWKKASLVFFYTGDSYVIQLAQDTVKLSKYLKGYDKTVLLKHTNKIGGIDLTGIAKKKADIYDKPTKTNFIKYIKQLAQEGYQMDIFVIGHGSKGSFRVSTGKNGSKGTITTKNLLDGLTEAKTGFKKLPIRLVYQGICYGDSWNSTWRKLGAKCTVGARFVNFYPNQMGAFLSAWNKGKTVSEALNKSNTAASRTVVQTLYILPHALANRKKWGGCPFGKTVLGKHSCAKKYFTKYWQGSSEYSNSMSGKQNMNYSSKMCTQGSTSITKKTTLTASYSTARTNYTLKYKVA